MTQMNTVVDAVTERIIKRSAPSRDAYLGRMRDEMDANVTRARLSCGNLAHACAANTNDEKQRYIGNDAPNIGIVTAYNDMLSAHQPFQHFPDLIKQQALADGATAQVAGGVPAMCDGITQGQRGMELSLFSRDVIAMSAAVALSHQCFDAVIYLGVCDKIIPGLTIAAGTFGHLPSIMLPAGPMPSGLPNQEKALVRQRFAAGEASKDELLRAEMSSYHSPGTCTFYGTANNNQLIMEVMGLHLPGASFVNPNTPLREALTRAGVSRALKLVNGQTEFTPACEILAEKNFVNALVALLASGGSTNLVIHLVAMARSAGIVIDIEDFAELSSVVPTLCRIYPNGSADVNHFQHAGGLPVFIRELLDAGLLHNDVKTVVGDSLEDYLQVPVLEDGVLNWRESETKTSTDTGVLASVQSPFSATGGLVMLDGNIGRSVFKASALQDDQLTLTAPAKVFHSQEAVKAAFEAGELNGDYICVVRFQGPRANGMPELHGLTPVLSALQAKGHQVALVTDGRMSGASGKVPAAIHVSPEALLGGAIAKIRDGDTITINAHTGELTVDAEGFAERETVTADLSKEQTGCGRDLFAVFRDNAALVADGASPFFASASTEKE